MSGFGRIIGGVVGAFFGGQIGFAIGSAIGGAFDPNPEVKGPRLNDLRVQESQTGSLQTMCFGADLLAGNVIYASAKREESYTEDGGKGGTDVVHYNYYQDIAIGLADAEGMNFVGIRKIKANGTIIYNVSEDADADTLKESQKIASIMKFYSGAEDQMPDPTIEAAKGVGKTPAHRGLCYVMFTNFNITDYNGQTPNFQFELIQVENEPGGVYTVPAINLTEPKWLSTSAGAYPVFDAYEYMFTSAAAAQVRTAFYNINPGAYNDGLEWHTDAPYGGQSAAFRSAGNYWEISYERSSSVAHDGVVFAESSPTRPPGCPAMHVKFTDYARPSSAFDLIRDAAGTNQYRALRATRLTHDLLYSTHQAGLGPVLRADHPDFNNEEFWRQEAQSAGIPANTFELDFGQLCDVVCFDDQIESAIRSSDGVSLSSIVTKICGRAGLSSADLDVSSLTDKVRGYKIANVATARENLNPLMSAFFFDGYCDGSKVRFKKRGSAPVATISYGDLAARTGTDTDVTKLSMTRLMEDEMPQKLTVNFIDFANSFSVGSESASRVTTKSRQQLVVEIPICLTHAAAAKIADITMRTSFVERHKFAFTCSRAYSMIEPTDVVDIESEARDIYRVRITKKDDTAGLIAFEAVSEDIEYTSNAIGGPEIIADDSLRSPGPTSLNILDIPMLQDSDSDAGFYAALSSPSDYWTGALIVSSLAGDNYATTGVSALRSASVGVCETVLGDWKGGAVFDKSSVFEITMSNGDISSKSRNLVLNGANMAVVGKEIIQFMTAELISENKYRISNLLRGVRGTEQHISTHTASEPFVFISTNGIVRVPSNVSSIGTERFYKAISSGQTLSSATAVGFTNYAKALMPLAPVRLGGGFASAVGGDLVINWQRRSRIDAGMRNNVGVPLGETVENYIVEILDNTLVKRSIFTNSPAAVYTELMQIQDFGSAQDEIQIRVYQTSEVVGKGFAASKTYNR